MCRKHEHQKKKMNSYNKQALDSIAKEQGFIRDNLEKVMRLVDGGLRPRGHALHSPRSE